MIEKHWLERWLNYSVLAFEIRKKITYVVHKHAISNLKSIVHIGGGALDSTPPPAPRAEIKCFNIAIGIDRPVNILQSKHVLIIFN